MIQSRPGYRRRFKVPRGALGEPAAPFGPALNVGARRDRPRAGIAAIGTLLAHAGVFVFALFARPAPPPAPPVKKEVAITIQRPRPQPPPPPPAPPPPPRPAQARRVSRPPPPAQSAKVIARAADPSVPLDATSFVMPVGEAVSYAGGYSSGSGTSTTAVAAANATPHAPPPSAPPPPPSKARAAVLLSEDWHCAWPDGEEGSDLNETEVNVRLRLDADGNVTHVDVLHAVNPNFASEAVACAMSDRHFEPFLDRSGTPIPGELPNFTVQFTR